MLERYKREGARDGVRLVFPEGEGRTRQEFQEECDVNYILRNYERTGNLAHFQKFGGDYGFAPAISFHEALDVVQKAEDMFSELPGKVRARFGGDPAVFLDFVQDPANLDEMRDLGLAEQPSAAAPAVEPEVATPPEAPAVEPTPPIG